MASRQAHSITSSAATSTVSGIVDPSALAVFRLAGSSETKIRSRPAGGKFSENRATPNGMGRGVRTPSVLRC
jgi:hypothetical protein